MGLGGGGGVKGSLYSEVTCLGGGEVQCIMDNGLQGTPSREHTHI